MQEWEEKLGKVTELAESYKEKYSKLKESKKNEKYMEQARSFATKASSEDERHDMAAMYGSVRSGVQEKAGSVVSSVNGFAQHAKTIVSQMNQFNCTGLNERNGSVFDDDDDEGDPEESTIGDLDSRFDSKHVLSQDSNSTASTTPQQRQSRSQTKPSRSFREYSKSPKRVDV